MAPAQLSLQLRLSLAAQREGRQDREEEMQRELEATGAGSSDRGYILPTPPLPQQAPIKSCPITRGDSSTLITGLRQHHTLPSAQADSPVVRQASTSRSGARLGAQGQRLWQLHCFARSSPN